MTIPESPMLWKEGWIVFDAVKAEPMLFQVKDDDKGLMIERSCLIFRTEAEGLAVVRRIFGPDCQRPNYPHRFPVRPMPRDVADCLEELRDRLNLQAFSDGETVWDVKDLH